jgi:hypothetical protein
VTVVALAGLVSVTYGAGCAMPMQRSQAPDSREQLLSLAAAVQDADYRGDLSLLRHLHARLGLFLADSALARDARYWRGFALWRRALNAANEGMAPDGLAADSENSVDEFRAALALDSTYVEAKIGAAASLMNAAYFRMADGPRATALMTEALKFLAAARRADPRNPRLAFVAAARTYWAPPQQGGDRQRAIADVERALAAMDHTARDPRALEPTWGMPELHMQLAFFNLNLMPPNRDAARRHARVALDLRPDWHYVRDLLLPQIGKLDCGNDESDLQPGYAD